jgi:hypothetical protein
MSAIKRHAKRDDRIQPRQACNGDHGKTCEHSHRRPNVGQQVFRVGLQGNRPVNPRSFQDPEGSTEIDCRCDGGKQRPSDSERDSYRIKKALNGSVGNRCRGDNDERPLETRREVLCLRLAKVVPLVGWARRGGQGPQRAQGRRQIYKRLDRIR